MTRKYFTVETVNALLPRLNLAALAVRDGAARLASIAGQRYQATPPACDSHVPPPYLAGLQALSSGLETIRELGGEMKDVDTGLVDFPARRNGEDVLLCWRIGEEAVTWWHTPQAGFGGRNPIGPDDVWEESDAPLQ